MSASNRALRDDGIVDEVAVEIVASGVRWVPLTRPERAAAAVRIRERGGSAALIADRLRVSRRESTRLLALSRDRGELAEAS